MSDRRLGVVKHAFNFLNPQNDKTISIDTLKKCYKSEVINRKPK